MKLGYIIALSFLCIFVLALITLIIIMQYKPEMLCEYNCRLDNKNNETVICNFNMNSTEISDYIFNCENRMQNKYTKK